MATPFLRKETENVFAILEHLFYSVKVFAPFLFCLLQPRLRELYPRHAPQKRQEGQVKQ
jgi:hypothetical protein